MATRSGSIAAGAWQTGNGSSAVVDISDLKNVVPMLGSTVALSGGTTVTCEISWDGTNFTPWNARTAVGAFTTIPQAKAMRFTTSAYSAGTAIGGFSGESALP